MAHHINEGDEEAFVESAESFVQNLQRLAKTKLQLQYTPVIEACMKIEDMIYMEALKDASLAPTASLWQHRRAIDAYQDLCDTVSRNLESFVRKDWPNKFLESPPLALFRLLSGRTHIAIEQHDSTLFAGGKRKRHRGRERSGSFGEDNERHRRSSKGKRHSKGIPKAPLSAHSLPFVMPFAATQQSSHQSVSLNFLH